MSYRGRHRPDTQRAAAKRTLTATGLTVLATAATLGASSAAWACPAGSDAQTRASVHHAVVHGHADASRHDAHASRHNTHASHHNTHASSTSHGASSSNPDGMSNGGADKPWGGAVANDDADGNNGSGNDADCEDDNNGVGTPGHCRTGVGAHAGHLGNARGNEVDARIGHEMTKNHCTTTTRQEIENVGVVHTVVHATGSRTLEVTVVVPGHAAHTVTVTAPDSGDTATAHVPGFVVAVMATRAGNGAALFTGAVVPAGHTENGSSVVPGIGRVTVSVAPAGSPGEVDVTLSRPSGETSTITVAAPVTGVTALVPASIAGTTVPVAVTGTSMGAAAAAVPGATVVSGASTGAAVLGTSMTRGATTQGTTATGASAVGGSAPGMGAAGLSAGASVSPSSTQLPFTGSGDAPMIALIGLGSVVTGAGVIRAARRRHPSS